MRANGVEGALRADIRGGMGGGFNPSRFLPFVMMHEFEGLLFSDCALFGRGIGRSDLSGRFQAIRDGFGNLARNS
jgi:hypothetical protein